MGQQSCDPSAGKNAEAVLFQMLKLQEAGDPDVRPDLVIFNSVITAWDQNFSSIGALSELN
jgi:hypothetical protein